MNGQFPMERGWSAGRWTVTIVGLFVVHALLAWRWSDRAPLVVREDTRRLTARLLPQDIRPELAALLELNNPTLFVLPSRAGFSGHTWLEVRPQEHRSPGWSNPPQWLGLKPGELLVEFTRFEATNLPERAAVSDRLSRPQPSRTALPGEFQLKPGTRVTIAGELSAHDLVTPLAVPPFDHSGLLAPTVVSVLVDQRGRVFQASLAPGGSSGSAAADRLALEHVRRLLFVIDPRISPNRDARDFEQLRRARVTVRWWTQLPASATNTPAAPPAAQPVPLQ